MLYLGCYDDCLVVLGRFTAASRFPSSLRFSDHQHRRPHTLDSAFFLMSPPPYACWASADEWRPGYVMLGANVNAIPAPPGSVIIIGSDGLWGAHEWTVYPQPYCPKFPYLPWIHLRSPNPSTPSNILTRPVEKTMWRSHGHRTDAHVVTPALLDELTKEWETIKSSVQKPFQTMSSLPSFSSVECPMEAYFRAATALN